MAKATEFEHPWPARLMHLTHLICIILLTATGFYIHKPNFSLFGLDMGMARYVHFIAGFVILLNSVVRVYWAFFGSLRDIRFFMPEKENRGQLIPMMKYYYFLRKTKPNTSKYNGWQKSTYVIWTIVTWFMGLTGLAMLWNTSTFWAWVVTVFGGLAMIHTIHYLVTWFFVFTVLFHVYLVFFEDFRQFPYMFFGIKPEEETN